MMKIHYLILGKGVTELNRMDLPWQGGSSKSGRQNVVFYLMIAVVTIMMLMMTIIHIGRIALKLTGLSAKAEFPFSGAGFTTSESEAIANRRVRPTIVRILILFYCSPYAH